MDWRVRSVAQLLVLGILLAIAECGTAEQRVVCYYTNWSVYRPGTAKFSPQNINPYLCTHLIYAFGGFTKENTLKPFDKYQDIEKGGYAKFTGLKTYNKNLKTMLAVGGWNEGSSRFSPMVADPERRKQFVRNTVKFLRQNHFDGLDLDWEYPAFRDGGKPRDKDNYASLVQELREAYERESSKTGRPRLLLSMAVPAGIEYINKGYDVPKLNKYLDFINLLSYDYHSSYEPAVNHHSPLYPLEEDNEYNFDTELTVDYTIKHLLESGATADKIVLGIPTYGRSYTLFNEDATDIGSPADGPGEEGDATREKGYLAYYEICEGLIDSDEWEVISPNPNAMGPYAYKGNQWVGYDDEAIVRLKAQYVSEHGLGGIMFWSIDNDDFRGKCHDRPYPLIEAAKEAMLAGSENTSVREKSTRPTKTRTESNFIGRKLGAGRRRTTEAPAIARQENSRKRVNSQRSRNRLNNRDNLDEEETEVQVNGRTRGQFFESEEDEDISKIGSNVVRSVEYGEDQERESSRPQNKNRANSGQGKRRRNDGARRRSTTAASISEPLETQARNHRITTPEPPTTPDPGTDFKCEDEGFFSHPRDCKKYFWCLDGGPGGLGIVAHHFTCPAGLVFNKAADSCDYPRNVVCPKAKPAESPTTRAPIIAATSRATRIRTTTRRSTTSTTTEPSEYSSEYEYYDDEDEEKDDVPLTTTTAKTLHYQSISRNRPTTSTSTAAPTTTTQIPKTVTSRSYQAIPPRSSSRPAIMSIEESVEDPKVIQELIELIKKAGGIEELEKQLHLQGKGSESSGQSGSATDKADVTPATISRSLYERVLNRQVTNGGNSLFRRTTVPPTTLTVEILERLDPQESVTQRSKPSFRNGPGQAQFEGLDDIPEVKSLRKERPQYVTINRQRPSTESPDESVEENVQDNTDEVSFEETLLDNPPEATSNTRKETHGYVDIRRSRTSTARSNILEEENESDVHVQRRRPITSETETEDEDDDDSKDVQAGTEAVVTRRRNQFPIQEETSGTTSRYTIIQRVRSTTQATKESSSEDDGQINESTIKSSNSPTDIITTTSPNGVIDDKISAPETTATNEAATEQSILYTTTPVIQSILTTQTPNLVSTDLPVQNIDLSTTLLPITVKVVEESSAVPTSTIVSSISTQESSSDELVTKGSTTVAQPRPFGFHRRTRPTTTTTTTLTPSPETTTSVNSDSGRVKVPTETVRLPTLKELIGLKTIVAHDYTSTTPITLSIQNLLDDDVINPSEYTKYISGTVTPTYEKELLPEELESTKTTGVKQEIHISEENRSIKYATLETGGNDDYTSGEQENSISHLDISSTATESSLPATLPIRILKQDKMLSRRPKIKLVHIPVRILESDRPLTDVILEVPEYKLNTILKSLLRVEIIDKDNVTTSNNKKSKDINTYSQRTKYNVDKNYSDGELTIEYESDELLSQDANTNSIVAENRFTSTPPSISTVRGSLLVTTRHSRNRGFYVTKSIESNTLYEKITPPTTPQDTELDNELTQRFSTTTDQLSASNDDPSTSPTGGDTTTDSYYTKHGKSASQQFSTTTEQLSTPNENLSTITENSSTTTSDYYTRKKESTSENIWPSLISTSLENFNNILANNDDIDGPALVSQKTTVTADTTSTEYPLSTTEKLNNIESTTEPAFTESDEGVYTSDSEETFGSYSTEGSSSTHFKEIFEPNLNPDIRFTTYRPKIDMITEDFNYYTATNTVIPDVQRTTINQNTYSTAESSTSSFEPISTTSSSSKINTTSEDSAYYTTTNTATPDVQQTTTNQNTYSTVESSTSGSELTSTTKYGLKIDTISKHLDYDTTINTVRPDVQQTTINQNTYSTAESSTSSSEQTSTATSGPTIDTISKDLDYYTTTNTATPDFQRTTINENTYSTAESSTPSPEPTSTATSERKINTISDDLDHYTTTNTGTPDFQRTTINQNTHSTTVSSTSGFEPTRFSTGFNFYTEASSRPDFQNTTISDFEETSDSTKFSSPETSTHIFENTATDTKSTDFNTEVNPFTEPTSIHSSSDFRTSTVAAELSADFKTTTFTSNDPLDNDSVSQTTATDSAGTMTSSVSTPQIESTTFSSVNPEISTHDFTTTSSVSTDSTKSDSITTRVLSTTIADETETHVFIKNDITTANIEVKTTIASDSASTTGLRSTVTIPTSVDHESATQRPGVSTTDFKYFIKTNQQVNAQTVSTLTTSGSESTFLPSSNANEITIASTTTKEEEPVNEIQEILTQAPKPFVPTRARNSALSRQSFYRSPTAVPGNKTERRRVIRKRIHGVRRPHVEVVNDNETETNITKLNTGEELNTTKNPRQRFIRRRIINHSTGKIVDQTLKKDSIVLENRTSTSNLNPKFVQKVNDPPELKNTLAKQLLRYRSTYRRQPAKNQTNSSIQANISSQNNSASNDVQSSSVLSTNPNQRRRIVVQRFRSRGSGLVKSSTVSPGSSPSPSSSLSPQSLSGADAVNLLNSTENTVEDKLQEDKRKTIGQDYTDITIDNLSSGSESYARVSVYGREELPRTESISEALKSEDEQANGEINLFKTRSSNSRKPGTVLRQTRPSASTSDPENEIATTIPPLTKLPNNVAVRRRFRLGQRPTTPSTTVGAQSEVPPSNGETLKSGAVDDVLKSLDQSGHAQEVEVTVAVENPSSPVPPVSTGRPTFRTSVRRRIFTTEAPQVTVSTTHPAIVRQRQRPQPFEKISGNQPARPRRPAIIDYDYYEDSEERIVGKPRLSEKISVTNSGSIRCLDQGQFPHPKSCKKFITCAKMVDGHIVGTEYTCPKRLSYDPVGGICNWSAGLGCKE